MYNLSFWWSLASLSVLIVYVILVFRGVSPLVATAIGVGLGLVFNHATPLQIGHILSNSLTSFLALVGFIIMLGRGLGEVLTETKVTHNLVHKIVYSIGVNTQTKVKCGVITSSIIIVGILGTLAGGLAILAPILRPIAASVGLSRPSLAVLMQASGEEALILGPFTPPVIALLGVTGLSYATVLTHVALPISCVTMITAWVMAIKLQKIYKDELFVKNTQEEHFKPNLQQNIATWFFIVAFIFCIIYGLVSQAKTSYVVFVMLFLALSTGLIGGLKLNKIFELILEGMKKNFHLFFIFLLLDPFLNLIQLAGGFTALTQLFAPLEKLGGTHILTILIGLTGAFGMPAAAAAVVKMLYSMFSPAAVALQLHMVAFAFAILIATRITNFALPGANMFAAMGFAESQNVKAMIRNGLAVASVQIAFLIIYSLFLIKL